MAPAAFTYASHAAMFVGFTPWVPGCVEPYLNPKFARIFKLVGALRGQRSRVRPARRAKHHRGLPASQVRKTVGTGAVGWFDPASPTGRLLTDDFDAFHYTREGGLREQLAFIDESLASVDGRPVFVFVNVGETHVPYFFEGAPWDPADNPCRPFAIDNDAGECRRRQRACLEWVDDARRALRLSTTRTFSSGATRRRLGRRRSGARASPEGARGAAGAPAGELRVERGPERRSSHPAAASAR
jgi:hypothetical protein